MKDDIKRNYTEEQIQWFAHQKELIKAAERLTKIFTYEPQEKIHISGDNILKIAFGESWYTKFRDQCPSKNAKGEMIVKEII